MEFEKVWEQAMRRGDFSENTGNTIKYIGRMVYEVMIRLFKICKDCPACYGSKECERCRNYVPTQPENDVGYTCDYIGCKNRAAGEWRGSRLCAKHLQEKKGGE